MVADTSGCGRAVGVATLPSSYQSDASTAFPSAVQLRRELPEGADPLETQPSGRVFPAWLPCAGPGTRSWRGRSAGCAGSLLFVTYVGSFYTDLCE